MRSPGTARSTGGDDGLESGLVTSSAEFFVSICDSASTWVAGGLREGAARPRRSCNGVNQLFMPENMVASDAHTWQDCGGRACGSRRTSLRHGQQLLVPDPEQRAAPRGAN